MGGLALLGTSGWAWCRGGVTGGSGAALHCVRCCTSACPAPPENIAWRAGFVFSLSVVRQMGLAALATHAYTLQITHMILLFGVTLDTGRIFNPVLVTALRAAGDARYSMTAGAASFLPVMAGGGSWWLGAYLGWGLVGVWIAYAADEWSRGLLMWRRWAGHGWVPAARQMHRRLRRRARPVG